VTPQQIAVIVVVATLGLLAALLVAYGRPRRAQQEPLPATFHRGDPDSVLENQRLAKVQTWGVAAALFITLFLVVYFVIEPFRESAYAKKFLTASIDRGAIQFRPNTAKGETGANCAMCHGPNGEGGFASSDPTWPAPPLNNEFARYTRDQIKLIIEMGRPGTPMPTWGLDFGGPLNDQKIDDILNFVETLQKKDKYELAASIKNGAQVFQMKCAVCHGKDAHGQGLGQPLPTFYAPDLTTEFYRLGLKVTKQTITLELTNKLLAQHAAVTTPTDAQIAAALAAVPASEIMDAGEAAAKNTIMNGRQNTPMPPWKDRIMPQHIDAVLAYLKSIQRTP
jgi:mono/diheme cytochrome c family protein